MTSREHRRTGVPCWPSRRLPEYALVELVRHLGTDVIHVAAAVTYTLLVLLAGLLARGLIAVQDARRTFGPPARIYSFRGYTVLVWDVNLLTRLR